MKSEHTLTKRQWDDGEELDLSSPKKKQCLEPPGELMTELLGIMYPGDRQLQLEKYQESKDEYGDFDPLTQSLADFLLNIHTRVSEKHPRDEYSDIDINESPTKKQRCNQDTKPLSDKEPISLFAPEVYPPGFIPWPATEDSESDCEATTQDNNKSTPESHQTSSLFAPEVYPPGFIPWPAAQGSESGFESVTEDDCKSEPEGHQASSLFAPEVFPPGYIPHSAYEDSVSPFDSISQVDSESEAEDYRTTSPYNPEVYPLGYNPCTASYDMDPFVDENTNSRNGMSDWTEDTFTPAHLREGYNEEDHPFWNFHRMVKWQQHEHSQGWTGPITDYHLSDYDLVFGRYGTPTEQPYTRFTYVPLSITQEQCEADPDRDMVADRNTPSELSVQVEEHPDSDLAIDNDHADDSNSVPCDSNMPSATTFPHYAVDSLEFDALTAPADCLNPDSPLPAPVDITLEDGKKLTLHPSERRYLRSYYDDLTYGANNKDVAAMKDRFTTAEEIVDESNWRASPGFHPEILFANLTDTITIPKRVHNKSRQENSHMSRVYRSVLHCNQGLAYWVGRMRQPLQKMYQQGTGAVHPDFPKTWGHVALLTEEQLDSIADFYHQTGTIDTVENLANSSRWCIQYPCPVAWKKDDNVWVKRRKMMNFIGIRQPELPPREVCEMLAELEKEIERRIDAKIEEEERIKDMRRKMYLCGGGAI